MFSLSMATNTQNTKNVIFVSHVSILELTAIYSMPQRSWVTILFLVFILGFLYVIFSFFLYLLCHDTFYVGKLSLLMKSEWMCCCNNLRKENHKGGWWGGDVRNPYASKSVLFKMWNLILCKLKKWVTHKSL